MNLDARFLGMTLPKVIERLMLELHEAKVEIHRLKEEAKLAEELMAVARSYAWENTGLSFAVDAYDEAMRARQPHEVAKDAPGSASHLLRLSGVPVGGDADPDASSQILGHMGQAEGTTP